MHISRHLAAMLLAAAAAAVVSTAGGGEVLRLDLDGSATGRAGGAQIRAELGPGARYVRSAEGRGVEAREGHAVSIPAPAGLWGRRGAVELRFRVSREVRISPQPLRGVLVESPLFRAELEEGRTNPVLRISLSRRGRYRREGEVSWGWLERGRWYHLVLTWDTEKGLFDAYLNGTLQNNIRNWRRPLTDWAPPEKASGPLRLGCVLGEGRSAARVAVDSVRMHSAFADAAAVAAMLEGRKVDELQGEGRTVYESALDLSKYRLEETYSADFTKPLDVVAEADLLDGDKRVKKPDGRDWVLEGPGRAWTEAGRLHLVSHKPDKGGHVVLWNTRVFPADMLLEFSVSPQDSKRGLNIVFIAARSKTGGTIFDPGLPPRRGTFTNYTKGAINSYHTSYWATSGAGQPRRAVNFRKNAGFYMPASGDDRIAGKGPGPHKVRVLKVGGVIELEARDVISAVFRDDGRAYGPVWTDGSIGLRQMAHGVKSSYASFKVWKVTRK